MKWCSHVDGFGFNICTVSEKDLDDLGVAFACSCVKRSSFVRPFIIDVWLHLLILQDFENDLEAAVLGCHQKILICALSQFDNLSCGQLGIFILVFF